MDNPATEPSTQALTTETATAAFADLLGGATEEQREPQPDTEIDPPVEAAEPVAELQAEQPMVTVKIDGKEVQVPLPEVVAAYQKDKASTQRFMEASETKKSAEAEIAKAQQERAAYGQNLQRMQAQLEGALQLQQQNTDWDRLLNEDPVEFLKQKHLAEQRQVALRNVYAESQRVAAQSQAEQAKAHQDHLSAQRDALLAKLPDWKDEAKAKAEQTAIREYLSNQGYGEHEVNNVADARAVVMARKAMLYDQMVSKAQAAAKKVSTLPTRVERPGAGETQGLDRRTAAFQRLSKSGSVRDAQDVFASLL